MARIGWVVQRAAGAAGTRGLEMGLQGTATAWGSGTESYELRADLCQLYDYFPLFYMAIHFIVDSALIFGSLKLRTRLEVSSSRHKWSQMGSLLPVLPFSACGYCV